MKGCLIVGGIIGGVLLVLALGIFLWFKGTYNSLVTADESVNTAWGQVESNLQRRSDLIPNLVATVKGYAKHEEGTLTAVIEARAKATQIQIDASKLPGGLLANPDAMKNFANAQGELSSTLSRLLVTIEKYPDLKADQQFLNLQHELAGTENRINIARTRFNDSVGVVNKLRRSFFGQFVAPIAGVNERAYFKADEKAQANPVVSFE